MTPARGRPGLRPALIPALAVAAALAMASALPARAMAQADSAAAKPPAAAPAPASPAAPAAKPAPAAPAAHAPVDQCFACHSEQDTPAAAAYRSDVHRSVGVTCAGCHGGDASSDDQDAAMSKAKGFIGVPKKDQIPAMCGKCHGPGQGPGNAYKARYKLDDVFGDFKESVHGHALAGNPKGPQCISCHGIHDIARVADTRSPVHPIHVIDTCAKCHSDAAYMRDFSPTLPVDQKEKYLTSVHGKRHAAGDPKVATCVSCHSNHRIFQAQDPRASVYATNIPKTCAKCHADAKYMAGYGIPTSQYDDYRQSVHGKALLVKTDLNAPACNSCHGNHGAAPPGASSVIAVCGRCHQSNQELYERSAHRAVFEGKKLPGCVVCHGNHNVQPATDAIVSFDPARPCGKCHVNSPADTTATAIVRLQSVLDSLSSGQTAAIAVLDKAENLGMDISDARYSLKDVNQSVVQARVAIHSFKVKEVEDAARPGIAIIAQARTAGQEAIHEYGFRRQGLAVSTLIVTFLVILLWLKIRDIERKQKEKGH